MTASELSSRKGIVIISQDTFRRPDKRILAVLFSNFFPMNIVPNNTANGAMVHYYGLSEHFEVMKEGGTLPTYDADILEQGDGTFTIKFKKVIIKPIVKDVVKGEVDYIISELRNNPTPEIKLEFHMRLGELFDAGYIDLQ